MHATLQQTGGNVRFPITGDAQLYVSGGVGWRTEFDAIMLCASIFCDVSWTIGIIHEIAFPACA
jgi:hypothetical protein